MHIPGSMAGRGGFAAAALAAVICTTLPPGPGRAPADGAPPSVPAAPLEWSPCPEAGTFDCAVAKVPLDHRNPGGRSIELALTRKRATVPGSRIGSLFINPGGPGVGGTDTVQQAYELIPAELRKRFDIVSWDPRGVGRSTAVRCFDSTEEAIEWATPVPAGFPVGEEERTTYVDAYADLGRRCEKRDPELLRHISTADTARDLDRLREAVGDEQMNFLGISYGSVLGATYANLFPDKVRAMVLDGNIDPDAWVNGGSKSEALLSTWLRIGSDVDAAATLQQFLALCGQATTDRCAFSAGDPEATRTKFTRLMQRLQQAPQDEWTYGATVSAVHTMLYTVIPQWTDLATVLQDLWQRRTPEVPTSTEGPSEYLGPGQTDAILCSESPNPPDVPRYPSLEQFSYDRAGDVGRLLTWATEACATWPARAAQPYTGPWNRATANPVLVVNTTYDPITPYQQAEAMTRRLAGARLLTLNGYGHAAFSNFSICVDEHESRYFVDGVLPPPGATCFQDEAPFSTSSPRGGIGSGGGGIARTGGSPTTRPASGRQGGTDGMRFVE
ncbi:alpha/beta hydrolase [Streptomyces sp. NPDC002133]|uniref:alpha/beta hydrolase n=1 Tax=Streptomyces sp. NPDC002133 TaxID=3154409 RepID=UPI00331AE0FE